MEEIYLKENVVLQCRDIAWLRGNVGKSEATLRVYADFVRNNAHNLPLNTQTLIVTDYVGRSESICIFAPTAGYSQGG